MTGDEARELFAYNAWANRKLFDAAAALSAELYHRDLKSSFGGIHGTLAHIVWAEQLWLCRWLGRPNPAVAQGRDLETLAAVRARWEEVGWSSRPPAGNSRTRFTRCSPTWWTIPATIAARW